MVITVSPNASETPSRPMPTLGKPAESTALPQPPNTSQNVPNNSANMRRFSDMMVLGCGERRAKGRITRSRARAQRRCRGAEDQQMLGGDSRWVSRAVGLGAAIAKVHASEQERDTDRGHRKARPQREGQVGAEVEPSPTPEGRPDVHVAIGKPNADTGCPEYREALR